MQLQDTRGEGKVGAGLHIAKQSAGGWVDATAFLDVRPASAGQADAFLKPGETFVFDGNARTSIVVKTISVANEVAVRGPVASVCPRVRVRVCVSTWVRKCHGGNPGACQRTDPDTHCPRLAYVLPCATAC